MHKDTRERVKSQKVLSFFLLLVSSFWHYQKDMVGGIEWPWGAQCLRPPKNSQVSFLHKYYKRRRRRSLCLAGFLDSPAAKAPKIKLCLRPSLLCYIIDDRRHWFSRLSEHTHQPDFFFFLTHTQENAGYSRFLTSRRRHIVWWNSFSSGWNRLSYQFFLFLWLFIDGEANIFVVCWQFDSFPAHVFLDISGLFFSLYTRDEWPLDSRYRTTSITSIRVWKK